jgi:hypothetical protein
MNLGRAVARFAIGLAVAVALVTGVVTPARAYNGLDWRTNPTLCKSGCATDRELIMFWQAVLWADNIGGGVESAGFIDGQFGPNTHSATWRWQKYGGFKNVDGVTPLTADGRVGRNSWNAAQLNAFCGWDSSRDRHDCTYNGRAHRVQWYVSGAGQWYFTNPNGGATVYI